MKLFTTKNNLQFKFLLTLSTAYLATSINMQGFMALMPFIKEDFALTRAQAGMYSTFFFLTATLIAIFSGRIVDLIGSKKGIVFGASSVGILIILHSVAPSFIMILILALFTGLGFSIITPSVNKAVMQRVKPQNRAISMGIMQSGGGIGGFLGASLLPILGEYLGWRMAILFSGVFALTMGLFISKTYQETKLNNSTKEKESRESFKDSFAILLKNKRLMAVCILGLAFGTSIGAIPAHYTIYLHQDLHLTRTMAGLSLGILQIGGIIGRPAWGWISDKLLNGSRTKGLILVGATLTLISFIFSFYITVFSPPLPLIFFFSFLLGIVGLGWMGLHFTTIAELASEKYTGIATGLALIFTRSGVVISPPLFGYLADLTNTYQYSWLAAGILIMSFTILFRVVFNRLNHSRKEI